MMPKFHDRKSIRFLTLTVAILAMTILTAFPAELTAQDSAAGPLKVHPSNPRYFTDGTGRAVYLTGSHTWCNFKDMGTDDPPAPFDFEAYLDFLQRYNHNFIRLWTWELSTCTVGGSMVHASPFPWLRTGPGALDGRLKFDLEQFNREYFDRLRARVMAAGERGIYVSIMLFEGWGLHASKEPWCWNSHPFNSNNNITGIDGDPDGDGKGLESQTLRIPEITVIQEAYVRKVIDTVNDLDNVLYEIVNESGDYSTEWQYHMIDFIHEYEQSKPKQHPVGMTFQWAREQGGTNANLFNSPADWISPNPEGGYRDNPPAGDGSKVILSDTDHLWGIGGNQAWVWKSFLRGLNPLFMDRYGAAPIEKIPGGQNPVWTDYLSDTPAKDPEFDPIRRNLGYTRSYATRMNLASVTPRGDLSSTGYCLANPGTEYLVYLPDGGSASVDLTISNDTFAVEWLNPSTGEKMTGVPVKGGGSLRFTAPFTGDAVLYLAHETGAADQRSGEDYSDPDKSYMVLSRGDVRAVIVNNDAVDDAVLPGHRAGYSGVASLTHTRRAENLFVPAYAGLNYEHIHDGTTQERDILFEPRNAPMEIRRIGETTVELYQPPTPTWKLESWLEYELLDDGAIEMRLECVPRGQTFKNSYIGLFFASYINLPESGDIHFLGFPDKAEYVKPQWIRGITPKHGVSATHRAVDDNREFAHDHDFPLTLVFNYSDYRYSEPWYYAVSHGMALVLMFRERDRVRLSQSPSGGGTGNPAWDFQWFIPDYEVGKHYRFVMRAMYVPFESPEQIVRISTPHRKALNRE